MTSTSRGLARIGVLVPFTNTNLEADLAMFAPQGISFHYARLGGYDVEEIPDSEQMAGLGNADLKEPLQLVCGTKPDVIFYGCTSATLAIGPKFDRDLAIQIKQLSGAQTVTAAGGLINALRSLDIKNIAFASPYVPTLNDDAITFLDTYGVETVSRADINETLGNYGQSSLSPERVLKLGLDANSPDAEAIVLSCTDMRAAEIIDELERQTGKPVITSNQAMLFEALQKLGVAKFRSGFGRLFEQLGKQ